MFKERIPARHSAAWHPQNVDYGLQALDKNQAEGKGDVAEMIEDKANKV
jgi:hypothetical protein